VWIEERIKKLGFLQGPAQFLFGILNLGLILHNKIFPFEIVSFKKRDIPARVVTKGSWKVAHGEKAALESLMTLNIQ